MSLTNVAYVPSLGWANPLLDTLEEQALVPMFGTNPVELGLADREGELLARLREDPVYQELFPAAFPAEADPYTLEGVVKALGSFQRTLLSFGSAYDRYVQGDHAALTAAQRRGMEIFYSEQAECFHCHGGFNFSNVVNHEGLRFVEMSFHNNGLYDAERWPEDNPGLFEITLDPADKGMFRAPTLRNIAQTAPYMHDGSLETLEEVVEHYARGGAGHPTQSPFVSGFVLSAEDKAALVSFLESLSDPAFLSDPRHGDPWPR
jgi:cytochrome c peroxidase